MSGYVASARIAGSTPRLAVAGSPPDADEGHATIAPATLVETGTDHAEDPLVERWSAFRARWSQLTFYLLDAESWRRG
jgi:hypothetical protein